jgi:hypothetical protein
MCICDDIPLHSSDFMFSYQYTPAFEAGSIDIYVRTQEDGRLSCSESVSDDTSGA